MVTASLAQKVGQSGSNRPAEVNALGYSQDGLNRNLVRPRFALAFALRRVF